MMSWQFLKKLICQVMCQLLSQLKKSQLKLVTDGLLNMMMDYLYKFPGDDNLMPISIGIIK